MAFGPCGHVSGSGYTRINAPPAFTLNDISETCSKAACLSLLSTTNCPSSLVPASVPVLPVAMLLGLLTIFIISVVSRATRLDTRSDQTGAVCTSDFQWATNSQHLSPCLVAAFVIGACNSDSGFSQQLQDRRDSLTYPARRLLRTPNNVWKSLYKPELDNCQLLHMVSRGLIRHASTANNIYRSALGLHITYSAPALLARGYQNPFKSKPGRTPAAPGLT